MLMNHRLLMFCPAILLAIKNNKTCSPFRLMLVSQDIVGRICLRLLDALSSMHTLFAGQPTLPAPSPADAPVVMLHFAICMLAVLICRLLQ